MKLLKFDGFVYFRKSSKEEIMNAARLMINLELNRIEERIEESGEVSLWMKMIFFEKEFSPEANEEQILEKIRNKFVEVTSDTVESLDISNYTVDKFEVE